MVVNNRNVSIKHLSHLQPSLIFFRNVRPYKKSNLICMGFIKYLVLMIVKGYMPLSIMEILWLKQMVLHLYDQI